MDDSHLLHELKVMAQAVMTMEQGLKRIDLLEPIKSKKKGGGLKCTDR